MPRQYLIFFICSFFLFEFAYAKGIADCRVIVGGTTECNPYGSKLIWAKEVKYDKDSKKLIISKTLPVPEKPKVKIISVAELIERYVKVENPLRFALPPEDTSVKKTAVSDVFDKNVTVTEGNVTKQKILLSNYTVVSGDVLSKIANKFYLKTRELMHFNHLDKKSKLKIGKILKIPLPQKIVDAITTAEYTIESGDTLLSIAYKFKIEPDELLKFNNIKSNTSIQKGKKLKLPLPYVKKRAKAKKRKSKDVKMLRGFGKRKLRVTATAYSSHRGQTDKTPFLAAWNNRLRPGMKIIAVSRDMLTRYGMKNGTRVRIGGLPGYYRVRDKMNKRYRKRIDIYMGINRRKALRWGRRSVVIYW
ncbi:MAG: hypothetical protein COA92_08810 [Sulfurovum sp.]|nr:MAG: hypothetical protein COA92_08810 [Sulfurovum sp.]